jgi:hypothetical protein
MTSKAGREQGQEDSGIDRVFRPETVVPPYRESMASMGHPSTSSGQVEHRDTICDLNARRRLMI